MQSTVLEDHAASEYESWGGPSANLWARFVLEEKRERAGLLTRLFGARWAKTWLDD